MQLIFLTPEYRYQIAMHTRCLTKYLILIDLIEKESKQLTKVTSMLHL